MIDFGALLSAAAKIGPAIQRLQTLIKEGAPQKDITAQRAVIAQIIEQFKQVIGTEPMPGA